jgi:hypothetical protein
MGRRQRAAPVTAAKLGNQTRARSHRTPASARVIAASSCSETRYDAARMALPQLATAARAVRWASVIAFGVSAVRHLLLAGAEPTLGRHAVFVLVNAAAAALLARRPRWVVLPIAILAVQQLASHGADLVRSLSTPGPLDVASLGVVVFFPLLLAAISVEPR